MNDLLLTPIEIAYLRNLYRADIDYCRTLAGNTNCSPATRGKLRFLERLDLKLDFKLTELVKEQNRDAKA